MNLRTFRPVLPGHSHRNGPAARPETKSHNMAEEPIMAVLKKVRNAYMGVFTRFVFAGEFFDKIVQVV